MIGRVGGAERPQQVDPVTGPDDRKVCGLKAGEAHRHKRDGHQYARCDGHGILTSYAFDGPKLRENEVTKCKPMPGT